MEAAKVTRYNLTGRSNRNEHTRPCRGRRQGATHEALRVDRVHHDRHCPCDPLKHECPDPHGVRCPLRLARDHSASHGPDNKQRIDWKYPSGHRICDIETLFLEQHVVLEDCDQEDDTAVHPEEYSQCANEPRSSTRHAIRLHAIQDQRDRYPEGAEEEAFDWMMY